MLRFCHETIACVSRKQDSGGYSHVFRANLSNDTNVYTIDYSVEPQIQNGSWKTEIPPVLKYRGHGLHMR